MGTILVDESVLIERALDHGALTLAVTRCTRCARALWTVDATTLSLPHSYNDPNFPIARCTRAKHYFGEGTIFAVVTMASPASRP
jgi:uncharacterized protein with PIN domain